VLWKPRAGPSTVADEGATTGRTRAKPNPIFYGHYSIECMYCRDELLHTLTVTHFPARCWMNKLLKTLLRTGVYFLDQADDATASVRGRVRDRVDDFTDRATQIMRGGEDHALRYAISFAAGVGLGIGAGILFAPASGDKTRDVLGARLQDFGESVRERFSSEGKESEIGTHAR